MTERYADGVGRTVVVEGAAWMDRGANDWWAWLVASHPHLTSPLEGGRDELGEEGSWAGGAWFLPAQE